MIEYLAGQTLAGRLPQGPVPLGQALTIATSRLSISTGVALDC